MVKVKADSDSVSISGKHGSANLSSDSASFSGKGGTISIGDPPPSGLIPIGDSGLYGTVDPIDPRDCEHYPDSPYCGGNPLTKDIVGLDVSIGVDGCSAYASVTPSLLFMKLPTQTIAYVKEECREEYEARQNSPEPPPPQAELPPEWQDLSPQFVPPGFDPNAVVCAVLGINWATFSVDPYTGKTWFNYVSVNLDEAFYPSGAALPPAGGYDYDPGNYQSYQSAIAVATADLNIAWKGGDYKATLHIHPKTPRLSEPGGKNGLLSVKKYAEVQCEALPTPASFNPHPACIYVGRYKDIFASPRLPFNSGVSFVYQVCLLFLKEVDGKSPSPKNYKKIPPPTKRKKCCMTCCSPSQQQQNNDNALLRQILKKLEIVDRKLGTYPFSVTLFDADDNKQGAQSKNVSVSNVARGQRLIVEREEKNAKSIGINEFPIYVPSTVVEDESNGLLGDLGDLKNKIFKQRIESVAELLAWKIKNDNEIYGKWQEYIEIEDSDPTKKGSQKKRVVLPNMARSFRELILLNSVQIKATGFILDAVLKMYIDLANTKVATATTEAIVRDIQDFLDYPTVERNLDVPLGIRIPSENDSPNDKEDIERFLQNSRVKAKFDDWTGEGSIHDMLVVLLDAASMIRAQMYGRG